MAERIGLVFGMGVPTLFYKEIRVSPKIRIRPCGTLPQTLDLENCATIGRSLKRVIVLSRQRWTLRA